MTRLLALNGHKELPLGQSKIAEEVNTPAVFVSLPTLSTKESLKPNHLCLCRAAYFALRGLAARHAPGQMIR